MTIQNRFKALFTLISLAMAFTAPPVHGEVIFTESFEDPVIPGQWVISGFNADGPWPGWVGVNRYTGMLNRAVNVEGAENFLNSFGDQIAYIFNNLPGEETGASLTTTPGSLDAVLTADTTYTLTFNTASDRGAAIEYHVELLAMDESADPVVETVLGTATGSLSSNDLAASSDRIVFTATAGHANLGERIAIRLLKGAGDWHYNVYYDNIQLDSVRDREPVFKRGDTDGNGSLDLTDVIRTLTWQFVGGVEISCPDAADIDDDGEISLTDAIRSLSYQFAGIAGTAPEPPGPLGCGTDARPDALPECVYPPESCQ